MSLEKELDGMMECFGNAHMSALAINAAAVTAERDIHIQHGLANMKSLGIMLKEHGKTELYADIQEMVLNFVRAVRTQHPKKAYVPLLLYA